MLEFEVGARQCVIGIDAYHPAPLDEGEEEIAKFLFDLFLFLGFLCVGSEGFLKFPVFFFCLFQRFFRAWEGEAYASHFFLHTDGFYECREGRGDAFEYGFASFLHLYLFPFGLILALGFLQETIAVGQSDMGVARDEFAADAVDDIGGGEIATILGNLGIEEEVHEEVAQFFFFFVWVVSQNGLGQFVDLFDGEVAEAFGRLFFVPRAFLAEDVEDSAEPAEGGFFFDVVHRE